MRSSLKLPAGVFAGSGWRATTSRHRPCTKGPALRAWPSSKVGPRATPTSSSARHWADLTRLMSLEILHVAFVLFGCRARLEGAEIAPLAGFRIDLAGIEPVLTRA